MTILTKNWSLCWFQCGPVASGVTPRDASDRLVVFQSQFETLYRKYQTYSAGEELFGLPVTEYPQLLEVREELSLLQKLYSLYNDVIDAVHRYYDVLWVDVNVDKITSELQNFQNKSEKTINTIIIGIYITCDTQVFYFNMFK